MNGNSFGTSDGGHVTGAVAMAINDDGVAVPVGSDTPIGCVGIAPESLEKLCRALAAHAAIITGKDADKIAADIIAFASAK